MSTVVTARRRKRRRRRRPAAPALQPYHPIAVPSAYERLLLNRLGQGTTPAALAELRAAGGAAAWFDKQLRPAEVIENPKVAQVDAWFAHLRKTPAQKVADANSGARGAWEWGDNLGAWSLLRRIYTRRTVLETMVGFWSDVLHVPAGHDRAYAYRFDYDRVIREHAFGRFEDLLRETALHPAMRMYLDNWTSKAGKPNENQGRELLELHSVGPGSGYTEEMVRSSAVLLSGYTVDWGGSYEPFYDPARHTTGAVQVLDFSAANAERDGQALTVRYLAHLAHHPATARTLARRLAVTFVGDDPPDALVDRLAQVYLENDTAVVPVLRELVTSAAFSSSHGQKVRTTTADLVATVRVLGVNALAPVDRSSWVHGVSWMHGGVRVYTWPRPDGAPRDNASWSSPDRVMRSFQMHQAMSGGYWGKQVGYVPSYRRMPLSAMTFAQYVDHLCRTLLGRPSTARLLAIACQATGTSAGTTVTPKHAVATYKFVRLSSALLDTPEQMTT